MDENSPKYPLYQFRAGLIHYRLGSLNHSSIWNTSADCSNKKGAVHLAKLHYEKAAEFFYDSMDAVNYFTVQMQRFALIEYLAECKLTNRFYNCSVSNVFILASTLPQVKITHYQECLEILLGLKPMLELIINKKIELDDNEIENNDKSFKSVKSLVSLLQNRIQCTLRNLTKLCLLKPPINKDCCKLASTYKACYALTLKFDNKQNLYDTLVNINLILLDIENNLILMSEI